MRICALNITHNNAGIHKKALIENCKRVASPDTEIVYKNTKFGTVYMPHFQYGYARFLNNSAIIEAMLEAQREGCDAIFHD